MKGEKAYLSSTFIPEATNGVSSTFYFEVIRYADSGMPLLNDNYSMTDMMRSTALLQLAIIVLLALWIPFICGVLGLA
jgi:hypothetical protein